jgi:two-component system OmpR family response regulator
LIADRRRQTSGAAHRRRRDSIAVRHRLSSDSIADRRRNSVSTAGGSPIAAASIKVRRTRREPLSVVEIQLEEAARWAAQVAPGCRTASPAVRDALGKETMRILLVEDDMDLQRLLKKALGDAGYVVDVAADGEEGHFLGDTEPYDAVVLDLGLPKIDGVTVLERWRKAGRKFPVLILTARDRWSDKVAGFDAGADDYVAKPFYTEELLARLRALLRRAAGIASPDIEVGPLRIDTRSSRVTISGNPIKLTSAEYRLLSFLAHHKGQVMSRTDLVEHLYDQDFDRDSNTIEVFVGRLRKKLGVDVIHTVRGLGYRLDEPSKVGDES